MIIVRSPYKDLPTFRYTIAYLLKEQFSVDFEIVEGDQNQIGELILKTRNWNEFELPTTHERREGISVFDGDNFDILYFLFLILSRYEETLSGELDFHGRFPSKRSFLKKWNILQIPVVDEYVNYLGSQLGLKRKNESKFHVTFDVDTPRNPRLRNASSYAKGLIKFMLGKEQFPVLDFKKDEYFNYPWIFSQLNFKKHHSVMFFISNHTHELDGFYKITDRSIDWLLKECQKLGVLIGNHGCYGSYKSAEGLRLERKVLSAEARTEMTHIRQHFLRFEYEQTLMAQEKAGFTTDWSLGFAEDIGFRAGTSRPFYPYSFAQKKALSIIEEPLLVMDATLAEPKYLNVTRATEMIERVRPVFDQVVKHQGHFNILFHNTYLRNPEMRKFFLEVLAW